MDVGGSGIDQSMTARPGPLAALAWSAWVALSLILLPEACLASPPAHASCLVQIIHTNDLHSQLKRSEDPARGGYAAVKAVIDQLKASAAAQGIPTLTLDAGDFTEGSEYYLADGGRRVFEIMNGMGYDAVTLGNHDWLMGLSRLDSLVGAVKPRFALLGANFIFGWEAGNLVRHMRQYVELKRGPARIAVLGLTTNEIFYSWRVDPYTLIGDALYEADRDLPGLKASNDFVIALTHLGYLQDRVLVRNTRGIDLVIGGHSHTELSKPVYVPDRGGAQVPIVQTGAYGSNVGDLLVDACPGEKLRVVSYRLVPVRRDGPRDPVIEARVEEAEAAFKARYGEAWLDEPVGVSEIPLGPAAHAHSDWGDLVADSLKEASGSEAAIDIGVFTSIPQAAGIITRREILALYPRMFEIDPAMGWNVWTAGMRGQVLRLALKALTQTRHAFSLSGIEMNEGTGTIRVGGKPLCPGCTYQVALPEGIVRGALGTGGIFRYLFTGARNTGIPIWTAIESRIRKIGVIRAPEVRIQRPGRQSSEVSP